MAPVVDRLSSPASACFPQSWTLKLEDVCMELSQSGFIIGHAFGGETIASIKYLIHSYCCGYKVDLAIHNAVYFTVTVVDTR